MTDTILIENISAKCIIGDLDWERQQKQPLLCNLELESDFGKVSNSDQLSDTLDYVSVSKETVEFLQSTECEMLEALADRLAMHLLKKFPARAVALTLWKQAHFPEAKRVGVKVRRERR